MEGFPLEFVAENTPKLEFLVGGNLEYTYLNLNVSDLGIRIFNITSLSFHYHHRIRSTFDQNPIFEIESVAREKQRQGLRLRYRVEFKNVNKI